MTLPLLLLTLSAAPLDVRVLERDRLTEVMLEADSFSCDGKALANRALDVRPDDRRLRAGELACEVVTAEGDVRVTSGALKRHYAGKLKLSNEAEVLRLINTVDVEEYLPGVVGPEAVGVPTAALDAQVIVSRTFALASRGRHGPAGYDLCDLPHCQLYTGELDVPDAARLSIKKSDGQVLLVGGVVLKPASFHSSCGGATSKAIDVLGEEGAGGGISDTLKDGPLCKAAPDFAWEWNIHRVELATALWLSPQGDSSGFEILRRDGSGRVLQLKSFGKRYSGTEFAARIAKVFGAPLLRSLKVSMSQVEGELHFKGTGFGNGVGLCQQGARAMAARGSDARAILARYFPDCQVRGF